MVHVHNVVRSNLEEGVGSCSGATKNLCLASYQTHWPIRRQNRSKIKHQKLFRHVCHCAINDTS